MRPFKLTATAIDGGTQWHLIITFTQPDGEPIINYMSSNCPVVIVEKLLECASWVICGDKHEIEPMRGLIFAAATKKAIQSEWIPIPMKFRKEDSPLLDPLNQANTGYPDSVSEQE